MSDDITETHMDVVRIITRTAISLSLLGDVVIMHGCIMKGVRNWTTYYRIIFLMAIVDLITSVWYGISDNPVPAPYGTGSQALCSTQGFFQQVGLAVPLLNSTLATNYLLVLKYGWPAEKIEKLEKYIYFAIFIIVAVVAIAPIPMKLYNYALLWCWIAPYPPNCGPESGIPCIRGEYASQFQFILFYFPLWLAVVYTAVAMYLVYAVVRDQDKRVLQFARRTEVRKFENTRRLMKQALLYVTAFFLTWLFVTILRVYSAITRDFSYPLGILACIFVPLQGFFNMLCFLYPRFIKLERMPTATTWQKVKYVLSSLSKEEFSQLQQNRSSTRQVKGGSWSETEYSDGESAGNGIVGRHSNLQKVPEDDDSAGKSMSGDFYEAPVISLEKEADSAKSVELMARSSLTGEDNLVDSHSDATSSSGERTNDVTIQLTIG